MSKTYFDRIKNTTSIVKIKKHSRPRHYFQKKLTYSRAKELFCLFAEDKPVKTLSNIPNWFLK